MEVSVGQIVGFGGEHGAVYPAIVTRVDDADEKRISLHVFHPDSGLVMLNDVELRYVAKGDLAAEGTWHPLEEPQA